VKKNTFNKALRHLKSTELDEKIQRLNEAPTNNIGGVYSLNRGGFRLGNKDPERIFYPDADGNWPDGIPGTEGERSYTRPAGYWDSGPGSVPAVDWDNTVDFSHSGTSTDGFIDPTTGAVLSDLPPDSRNFILGPLVDGYAYGHGYDDRTSIGYIQKDTREFVLLASIPGYWRSGSAGRAGAGRTPGRQWDGETITIHNPEFTLEMAQWFRDQYVSGRYIKNVSYFYNGGQPQSNNPDPNAPSGSKGGIVGGAGPVGGGDPDDGPYGEGGDPNIGTPQDDPNPGGPEDAGFPWGLFNDLKDLLFGKKKKKPDEKYGPAFGDDEEANKERDKLIRELEKNMDQYGDDPKVEKAVNDWNDALYKAGGGDAAQREKGQTRDDVIDQGRKNLGLPPTPPPKRGQGGRPLGDTTQRGGKNYGDDRATKTGVPAFDYSTDIARSILRNKPLNIPQSQIPKNDIKKLVDAIPSGIIGSDHIPVTDKPIPYSDDNFYEDENGNVRPHTPETKQKYPNNTSAIMSLGTGFMGLGNPLGSAGKAQGQIVVPSDGSEPYFLYTDHAYHNLNSNDPGEVPDPIKTALSAVIHNVSGKGDSNAPNTGEMSGYPSNIKGDVRKQIKVPLKDLTPEQQKQINKTLQYQEYVKTGKIKESFNLTESRKKILREVKKPYALPEYPKQKLKKYKPNFAGKYSPQNTPDVTACKESDEGVRAKNAAGQMWRTKDRYWSRYQSTERMNVVYDQVGHGDQYWEMIINENQNKKKIRDRKVQEHLNILAHERAMLKENPNFKSPFREKIQEQETLDAPNDPLFNRVSKKLKLVIDYPDKPSKNGYPNTPPPEMVNGFHPEYGQDKGFYNKLDPQSANAMPSTGNPEIDAKVQKAAMPSTGNPEIDAKVQKARRIKNLMKGRQQ